MKTIGTNNSAYTSIEQTLWKDTESHEIIKLNCNESPFDLPTYIKRELTSKMMDLAWNRYPDLQQKDLASLIAESVGLQTENILFGNGSSQLIQQIVSCCAKFIDGVIIENPTFTLYHQFCQNERLTIREWNLNMDDSFEMTNFPQITEPSLVIITSPNNPTGAVLPTNQLKTLLSQNPGYIFLVDEAYAEFANESAVALINDYSNLLVLKTFSKGLCLPSIRFGYVLGDRVLIDLLRKFTLPFTVNIFTELVVRESLTNSRLINILKVYQERIKNLRDFTYYLLSEIADNTLFSVYPSASNFLFLRFHESVLVEKIKNVLTARNITVSYPIANCLRLTIGTEVEMSKIVGLIKQIVDVYKCDPKEMLKVL